MEYPLLVEAYGLVEDSGGAGTYRGGLGLRRVVRPVGHDCTFNGVGERFRHEPWGLFGGQPGQRGQFSLLEGDACRKLADKSGDLTVSREQRVMIETPGAGGFGPPSKRAPDLKAIDEESGKFTPGYLAQYDPA